MADSDDENGDDGAPVKNLVARCTELKAVGNEHFKAGRCDEAVVAYQKAVDKLTSAPAKKALAEFFKASPDSPDTATPLLSSLHGNMAACHVKASQWESAIRAASEALKLEPDNLKARFRRGVACSHVGQHAEAKADLTAVARADATNREARRLLEGVNTALKQQRSSERAMFGKAFEGIRKEEESKAAAEAAAEAERKAAAEAAELRAWREECNALRDRVAGPKPTTDRLRLQAREGGAAGEAAQKELDRLAPISLKDFREARRKALAKAAAEEQAAREEELAARQRAEAQSRGARSDVTSLGADGDGDADMEALLRGLNKGYKTRADGSKTSYFDRSDLLDEKTKALLAAQKAPKRIDAASRTPPTAATTTAAATGAPAGAAGAGASGAPSGAAPAAAPAAAPRGSAWNAAGTYEERDVSPWATAEVTARLGAIRLPLGADLAGAEIRARAVTEVEGHASVVTSRGKVRRPFEFKLDLAWEIAGGDPDDACEGVISYGEISPAPTGAAEPVTVEILSERLTKAPANAAAGERAKAALGPLRAKVLAEMAGFVAALAMK